MRPTTFLRAPPLTRRWAGLSAAGHNISYRTRMQNQSCLAAGNWPTEHLRTRDLTNPTKACKRVN